MPGLHCRCLRTCPEVYFTFATVTLKRPDCASPGRRTLQALRPVTDKCKAALNSDSGDSRASGFLTSLSSTGPQPERSTSASYLFD
eukprot:766270-Hanusia_phi.AAC.5